MGNDVDERDVHFGKKEGWSYPSRAFGPPEQRLRIVTQAIDTDKGLRSAKIKDEVVLRVTPSERYEIKATLVETDRSIQVLTIQKYNARSGPSDKFHFSFLPNEVEKLIEFLVGLQSINLESPEKARISPETLRRLISDRADALRVYEANPEVLSEIVQNKFVKHDLVAIGYRREQLKRFKCLLDDPEFFAAEQELLDLKPEALWQQFFTNNSWIFGYGLSYQFLTPLSERDPEQVVLGASVVDRGKRADALLKTRGQISSLCYVEIIIRQIALTGCRSSEMIKLRWIEADMEASCLRLVDSKEGASTRAIGLPVVEFLERRWTTKAGAYVFPGQGDDNAFGSFPNHWEKIFRDTSLADITPHVLRHSFASIANDLGFTEVTIAALVGHAKGSVTSKYIHTLDTALIMAADTISGYIQGLLTALSSGKPPTPWTATHGKPLWPAS